MNEKMKRSVLDKERVMALLSEIGVSTTFDGKPRGTYDVIEDIAALWAILSSEYKKDLYTALGLL